MAVIEVGPAALEELDEILRIQSLAPTSAAWSRSAWLESLKDRGDARAALTARVKGRLAGFILWQKLPESEAEILNLAVDPAFRRQGVASALLVALEKQTPGALFLEVRASNGPALAFYRHHGFERVGRRPKYYHSPVEDAILLCRRENL